MYSVAMSYQGHVDLKKYDPRSNHKPNVVEQEDNTHHVVWSFATRRSATRKLNKLLDVGLAQYGTPWTIYFSKGTYTSMPRLPRGVASCFTVSMTGAGKAFDDSWPGMLDKIDKYTAYQWGQLGSWTLTVKHT